MVSSESVLYSRSVGIFSSLFLIFMRTIEIKLKQGLRSLLAIFQLCQELVSEFLECLTDLRYMPLGSPSFLGLGANFFMNDKTALYGP